MHKTPAREQTAAKCWCFTIHLNQDMPWRDHVYYKEITKNLLDFPQTEYGVFQLEQAPETGRYHVQAYFEFNKPLRMNSFQTGQFQRYWTDHPYITGFHAEKRKATRERAREYCMKEETQVWGPCEVRTNYVIVIQ